MINDKHGRILDSMVDFITDTGNAAFERRAMLAAWHAANNAMCPPDAIADDDLDGWTALLNEAKEEAVQYEMDRAGAYGL